MKFTLSWLKEHLQTDATLDLIVETLTRIGLEVERVEDRSEALVAFRIARVISAEPHPNADKLRVCMVDTGSGDPVQVVCGAPNARTGMTSVFSPPGAWIPGKNMTLAVGSIRGVESRGMRMSRPNCSCRTTTMASWTFQPMRRSVCLTAPGRVSMIR
jgi:phenylalanyl-tRNA synthetase beta chain